MRATLLVPTALLFSLGSPLLAQSGHSSGSGSQVQRGSEQPPPPLPPLKDIERAAEDESGHIHYHKHHAALFVGGSHFKEEDGFTVGGDYEYRLHRLLGLGFEGEYAGGDLRETVVVFPVFFHPGAGLKLAAGPGFERAKEEAAGSELRAAEETRTNFLFRVSILYDFLVKERFTITPNVSLDFVNGRQVWVYGVSFGVGF